MKAAIGEFIKLNFLFFFSEIMANVTVSVPTPSSCPKNVFAQYMLKNDTLL